MSGPIEGYRPTLQLGSFPQLQGVPGKDVRRGTKAELPVSDIGALPLLVSCAFLLFPQPLVKGKGSFYLDEND